MKNNLSTLSCLFAAIAVTGLLTACNNPESDFKKAEQANTEQAYDDFIKKYPDSPLVVQAKSQLESLAHASAQRTGTSAGFVDFLKRFPTSKLSSQAKSELEMCEYHASTNANNIPGLEAFLLKYPDSTNAVVVKKRLDSKVEERDWNAALSDNTPQAYLVFSVAHPHSSLAQNDSEAAPSLSNAYESMNNGAVTITLYQKNGDNYRNVASCEVRGRIRFNATGIIGNLDSLQRLRFTGAWLAITNRELIRGNAIVTSEDGKNYVIFNLQAGSFAGQIERVK
jgi:hypothetical protein